MEHLYNVYKQDGTFFTTTTTNPDSPNYQYELEYLESLIIAGFKIEYVHEAI